MPIEINDLECRRFGIVAARLTDPGASLGDVDQAAMAAGVDMLTTRIDASDLPRAHALEDAGYRLMDTLVYYGRTLDDWPGRDPAVTNITLSEAAPQDRSAISALARAAFSDYIGHYHADPRLDSNAADAAYVEWAEVCAASSSADAPVLVARDMAELLGFLALRRNTPDEFEIVLNAVHPAAQGQGVYKALVARALERVQETGARRIIVSTQINNYAVQRVWSRLGFSHYRSIYTFHKWFTP